MRTLKKHYDFTKMSEFPRDDFNIRVGEKWANGELQQYVDSSDNLFLFDEGLVMRATLDSGIYRSARIDTRDKFAFKYGKIEFTAKLPTGKGTWPALWLMSQEQRYGHWPKSGEIDVMEHVGRDNDMVFLCLHSETYNHTNDEQYYYETRIPGLTTGFHRYAVDWYPDRIAYYIDDAHMITYHKTDKADQSHKGWPFDQEFFIIMNLAIGGKFGGSVDDSIFPQEFIVSEIKVYE